MILQNCCKNRSLPSVLIKLMLVFLLSGFGFSVHAQTNPLKKTETWESIYSDNQIEIFQKYERCNIPSNGTNEEVVYLRIVNKTSAVIDVSWKLEMYYDGVCHGCTGQEYMKTVQLSPNGTISGTCSESSLKELRIFSKMVSFKTRELTGFELKNVHVTKH
jgi:hypothetical protein